jgi:signal transduction histidine kinase
MLMPVVKQKKIELRQVVNVEHLRRMGDPLRFRQIVFNLASNALKFTPEGGTVTIAVYEGDQCHTAQNNRGESFPCRESRSPALVQDCALDEVTVEVSDTGIGIPEGLLPGLFKVTTSHTIPTVYLV